MENDFKFMKKSVKQIQDLNISEYNPRQIRREDFDQLKDSIKKFGFVEPIIVNINPSRENNIVGGHQRVKAAAELGYEEVECVEIDLDEEGERELLIRLNRNSGEFDYDALANLFEVSDLLDWGFSARELDFDLPELNTETEEIENIKPTRKLEFKLKFESEEELDDWYDFVNDIKVRVSDVDSPTIAGKIIKLVKEKNGSKDSRTSEENI